MNLLIAIPTVVALSIVLIICVMIILRDTNRCKFIEKGELTFGEDKFQKDCENGNGGRPSIISACFTLNVGDDKIQSVINTIITRTYTFTLNYFKKYPRIYNKINKKRLLQENVLDNIYDNIENNLDVTPLIIIYSYSYKKILIVMDHTYIGGYYFQQWGTYIFGGDIIDSYILKYQPGLTELNSIRFLLFDVMPTKIKNKNSIDVYKNRNMIRRVGIRYNVGELQKKYNAKVKPCIIYTLSQLLFKYLDINRSIDVIIPVAFKSDKYAYNNIGAIILNINKTDTPHVIFQKLKENAYQSMATNHLMQIINGGKEARTYIDAVFTIGFIKNPKLIAMDELSRVEVSYIDLSFYGLYIASFTINNIVHVSITVMTPHFNTQEFLGKEEDSFEIFKSI